MRKYFGISLVTAILLAGGQYLEADTVTDWTGLSMSDLIAPDADTTTTMQNGTKTLEGNDNTINGGGGSLDFKAFYLNGGNKKLTINNLKVEGFNSGAIYTLYGSVEIKAVNKDMVFEGNKSEFNGTTYENRSSAIGVHSSTVNLSSQNGYSIIFKR